MGAPRGVISRIWSNGSLRFFDPCGAWGFGLGLWAGVGRVVCYGSYLAGKRAEVIAVLRKPLGADRAGFPELLVQNRRSYRLFGAGSALGVVAWGGAVARLVFCAIIFRAAWGRFLRAFCHLTPHGWRGAGSYGLAHGRFAFSSLATGGGSEGKDSAGREPVVGMGWDGAGQRFPAALRGGHSCWNVRFLWFGWAGVG